MLKKPSLGCEHKKFSARNNKGCIENNDILMTKLTLEQINEKVPKTKRYISLKKHSF